MAIFQCPRCELRFLSKSEVEWHMLDEHESPPPEPVSPAVIERGPRTFGRRALAHSLIHR